MFGPTNSVVMLDDGLHGDGAAGDGIFGAIIPASSFTNGQMVRYYIVANDALNNTSRWPLFEQPLDSEEYLGTVVADPALTSQLPIFHLFISAIRRPAGAVRSFSTANSTTTSAFTCAATPPPAWPRNPIIWSSTTGICCVIPAPTCGSATLRSWPNTSIPPTSGKTHRSGS
jgi:hypothetical protein